VTNAIVLDPPPPKQVPETPPEPDGTLDAAAVLNKLRVVRQRLAAMHDMCIPGARFGVQTGLALEAVDQVVAALGQFLPRKLALVGAEFALVPGASWGAAQGLLREMVRAHPAVFLDWRPYRDAEVVTVGWPYRLGAAFAAADKEFRPAPPDPPGAEGDGEGDGDAPSEC
jgi:hypothetical protein